MTATQPTIYDALAAIAHDPVQQIVPTQRDYRADILRAVSICAAERGGRVHISWVREFIPADVPHYLIGAVMSGLHTSGHLVPIAGKYLPNDGPSGNGCKPARVSRLVRLIA